MILLTIHHTPYTIYIEHRTLNCMYIVHQAHFHFAFDCRFKIVEYITFDFRANQPRRGNENRPQQFAYELSKNYRGAEKKHI